VLSTTEQYLSSGKNPAASDMHESVSFGQKTVDFFNPEQLS
jgi:hypothetical protein